MYHAEILYAADLFYLFFLLLFIYNTDSAILYAAVKKRVIIRYS